MSAPRHNIPRELCLDIEHIADEAGAVVVFQKAANAHNRATFTYQGRSRFVVISSTPRGAPSAFYQAVLSDVRRTLRELGYIEPVKAPASAPKDKPWRNRRPRPTERRSITPSGPRYRPRYGSEINAMTVKLRELRARMY
jgi:hypothetical protein